jgi:hypothetical protein
MLTDLASFRILLKSPGFSTLIVVVLAVGIGASRAISSIVNSVTRIDPIVAMRTG